jgi:GT2 family glycosyltransferase
MNQHQPSFSIIIPTYRRPRQLAACLESLTRLDYPRHDFEVIVVDDGSEPPPEAAVALYRDRLDVTLLQQSHAGPAAARNLGAAHAGGTFLAFTDDDCRPAADWLRALARSVARDPECMIGGRTFNALPDNAFSSASQLLIDYLCSYYNADSRHARFLTSNNLAVRADRFRAVGGFDTAFGAAAGEDREFCDRWLSHGYRVMYDPSSNVYHAHVLTFRGFWRQHFGYGRAAFHFHRIRARRADDVNVEPLGFYLDLLRYPFSHARGAYALTLASLFMWAQAANVAGFFWEKARVA